MEGKLLSSGEFARQAGVTLRTIRYYDRLGLLRPAVRARDGRRRYGAAELVRLQQILTLKFLGFALEEIARIVDAPAFTLEHALRVQQEQVAERIAQWQQVLRALTRAREALATTGADWESFTGIITAMQMDNQYESWYKRYYSEEQLAKLQAQPFSAEDQARAQAEWGEIMAEVKRLAAAGADPDGVEAQAVAVCFQAMIDAFTQGDPEMEASLNRMYADRANMPPPVSQLYDDATGNFITAMRKAYRERHG